MKSFNFILIIISMIATLTARASGVVICDTIVEILEQTNCPPGATECEINFKSKCTFNNRGHSMRTCNLKGDSFKAQIKIPEGGMSFNKGDNIKLNYVFSCGENGCSKAEWEYLDAETCGFWRSLF
ncbi:MAG: hypothetical protein IPM97_05435 [Bdellovibrionaceae bacterium]|nr:hypothetical protein [Pseudobdellovibrionaceae bacterium]